MDGSAWIVLFLVAFAVRAVPWPTVFAPDGVHLWEPDAYYHLRRIYYTVVFFPSFLAFDPWLHFPSGAKAIWTPVLDWSLAAIVRPFATDRAGVERIVVWAPPLLGALTVVATFGLARRYFGRYVAWISGALLSILPAHFWFSQLGYVDHHVAVALLTVLLLAATMGSVEDVPTGPGPGSRGLRRGAALGVAMGAALATWPGCLLHVAIVEVVLVARLVAEARRPAATALAYRFAWAHLVAAVLVAPFGLGAEWERWGAFSPVVLSNFQPLALASAAVFFAAVAELWRRFRFPAGAVDRALWLALGAGLLAGSIVHALSSLESGLGDAFAWFAKTETFQASVGESTRLFWTPDGFDRTLPEAVLSRFVYAVPLMVLAFAVAHRRERGRRAAGYAFLAWTVALFLATLVQHRFMNSLAPAYAVLVAWVGVHAWRLVRRWLRGRRAALAFAVPLAASIALFCFEPTARFYGPYLGNVRRFFAGQPAHPYGWSRSQVALLDVARWLRRNSPPVDTGAQAEYSILASWSHGHMLRYVSQRPVAVDNFGDDVGTRNYELVEEYFASEDEAQALRVAEALRVRYVLVDREGSGHSRGYGPKSTWSRLLHPRVLRGPRRADAPAGAGSIPAPSHHRLVYESPPPWGRPRAAPQFLVYEIVPGARVVGSAEPGEFVTTDLTLKTHRGRVLALHFETRADAAGRYELMLPYPNGPVGPSVLAAPFYELRAGEVSGRIHVDPETVDSGEAVDGPDLRRPRS